MNLGCDDNNILTKDPLTRFYISIMPAIFTIVFIYSLGPDLYIPAFRVFMAFYFALGVGWIVSPAIALAFGMRPVNVVILLVFISSQSSLIVSANYPILEKIPYLGSYMNRLRNKAVEIIEKRDMVEKIGYLSIFWLMFLPIYGSGPNVMTLVGRLLGLGWKRVWLVITLSATFRFSIITTLIYLGYISL